MGKVKSILLLLLSLLLHFPTSNTATTIIIIIIIREKWEMVRETLREKARNSVWGKGDKTPIHSFLWENEWKWKIYWEYLSVHFFLLFSSNACQRKAPNNIGSPTTHTRRKHITQLCYHQPSSSSLDCIPISTGIIFLHAYIHACTLLVWIRMKEWKCSILYTTLRHIICKTLGKTNKNNQNLINLLSPFFPWNVTPFLRFFFSYLTAFSDSHPRTPYALLHWRLPSFLNFIHIHSERFSSELFFCSLW